MVLKEVPLYSHLNAEPGGTSRTMTTPASSSTSVDQLDDDDETSSIGSTRGNCSAECKLHCFKSRPPTSPAVTGVSSRCTNRSMLLIRSHPRNHVTMCVCECVGELTRNLRGVVARNNYASSLKSLAQVRDKNGLVLASLFANRLIKLQGG